MRDQPGDLKSGVGSLIRIEGRPPILGLLLFVTLSQAPDSGYHLLRGKYKTVFNFGVGYTMTCSSPICKMGIVIVTTLV